LMKALRSVCQNVDDGAIGGDLSRTFGDCAGEQFFKL
jgi:hypothetical protein